MRGGSYASPDWSDLPIDLLILVVRLLDLPEALAFRAVCPSWRSASMAAAGAPRAGHTPWFVSLAREPIPGGQISPRSWDPAASSKFRNLLDQKTFRINFPQGKAVALCGASHGWLVLANELSDLMLYDPFTAAMVSLRRAPLTPWLYDKVVLSGSPSAGAAIAFAVHTDGMKLSYTRVGGTSWWQVLRIQRNDDCIVDCVHHGGRFYALTMKGLLVSWDFERSGILKREEIITKDDNFFGVITRYLVSTPWGHLLQVRVILDSHPKNGVRVEIDMLDLDNGKMVGLNPVKSLRGHTVFLGQNSPGILSTNDFPGLRPDCIYFTTPRLKNEVNFLGHYNRWSGIKIYDLKKQKIEDVFPSGGGNYETFYPSSVWFTPSL